EKQKIKPSMDLTAEDVNITVTNLTNSRKLSGDLTASAQASARLMGTSPADLTMKINPVAKHPTFHLTADVKQFDLRMLTPWLEWKTGTAIEKGFFSVFTE